MKIKCVQKEQCNHWENDKAVTTYFVSFLITGNKSKASNVNLIRLLTDEEEYNSYTIGQEIEVNPKS